MTFIEFFQKYNTSSKCPKFYERNGGLENDVTSSRHFFKVELGHVDDDQYVYVPVREVMRCVCIEMVYVTSGDIYYLRLILLNRKARNDEDVLT